jgi:Lar family restriction alleviation protein
MTSKELKPCPFCGKTPVIMEYTAFAKPKRYYIKHYCGNGTSMRVGTVNLRTEEETIAVWNERIEEKKK